jgi:hypothetical protein
MIAFLASVIGLYKLWRSGKFGVLSFRFQKVVPAVAFLITAIACLITNSIFKATTWPDVSEESLVSYAFIQLVYAVFMTGNNLGRKLAPCLLVNGLKLY